MKGYNQYVSEAVSLRVCFSLPEEHNIRRGQCQKSGRVWVADAEGWTPERQKVSSVCGRVTAAVQQAKNTIHMLSAHTYTHTCPHTAYMYRENK